MQTTTQNRLLRKQYLVTPENVSKIDALAKADGTSATDIVRKAIDAYEPQGQNELTPGDFIALVSERLTQTIKETQTTRRRLNKALKTLENKS